MLLANWKSQKTRLQLLIRQVGCCDVCPGDHGDNVAEMVYMGGYARGTTGTHAMLVHQCGGQAGHNGTWGVLHARHALPQYSWGNHPTWTGDGISADPDGSVSPIILRHVQLQEDAMEDAPVKKVRKSTAGRRFAEIWKNWLVQSRKYNLLEMKFRNICSMLYWLVVWNMAFIFPFSWECHHPNWRTPIFQRGWNHQQVYHEAAKPSKFRMARWATRFYTSTLDFNHIMIPRPIWPRHRPILLWTGRWAVQNNLVE